MKIVSVVGSPRRKGNSAAMAEALCRAAGQAGAEVESHFLNGMDFRGCQGCLACKTRSDRCVVEDDLFPVLESVRSCDVLVMSSPVYFGQVSAQLKGFIDRTFCYLVPDYATAPATARTRLSPGKRMAMLLAQGHPKEKLFANIFPEYDYFYRWLGFRDNRQIRACGIYHLGDAAARAGLLEECAALGRELAVSGS